MKTVKYEQTNTGYTLILNGHSLADENTLIEDLRKRQVRVADPIRSKQTKLLLSPLGKTDVLQVIKDMGATPL